MKILNMIFILNIFSLFSCQYIDVEEDLVEGIKSYDLTQASKLMITYNAKDNGVYAIFFEEYANIVGATGKINIDCSLNGFGFYTKVFAQNFTKGDYVKIEYPGFNSATGKIKIVINKINAYFRLLNRYNTFLSSMDVIDCSLPIYIFTSNDQPDYVQYVFHGQVHFGEFTASYRTTDFHQTDSIDGYLKDLQLNSLTDLPMTSINIIKMQCIKPGIITFYLTYSREFRLFTEKKAKHYKTEIRCHFRFRKCSK